MTAEYDMSLYKIVPITEKVKENYDSWNYLYFFKSMDRNVPCILGNNTLINDILI